MESEQVGKRLQCLHDPCGSRSVSYHGRIGPLEMGSLSELVAPTEQPLVMRGQVIGCIPNAGKKTDGPARNFTDPDGNPVTTDVARHPPKVVYRLPEFNIPIKKLFYVSPSVWRLHFHYGSHCRPGGFRSVNKHNHGRNLVYGGARSLMHATSPART